MKISFTLAAFLTAILILTSIIANAQVTNPSTYDLQFGNPSYDCSAGTFCTDIQIKAADGANDFVIGSHTVYLNYDKATVTNAIYTPMGLDTSLVCVVVEGVLDYKPYNILEVTPNENGEQGELSINLFLESFFANFECPVISSEWLLMGSVCFEVLDANSSISLSIDPSFTAFNDGTNNPEHTQGSLGSLDVIPASLAGSLDAGTPSFDNTNVCFGESINFSVTDPQIGDGNYIGIAVSPENNLSNATDFANATKYFLQANTTASATNDIDGTGMPTNTPLYFYSFIGEGNPADLQMSINCSDINKAAEPFYILEEIEIGASDYACTGDGTALLNLAAIGGMPALDVIEEYSISASGGATYTGGGVGDNEIFQITATDGVEWTVTLTDSDGCTASLTSTFSEANDCESTCTAVAGNVSVNTELICYGDSILVTAADYTLGVASGYVGMVLSPDAALDDLATDVRFGLLEGPSAYYVNSDLAETNQPVYAYSFIGEGEPFSFNPLCMDISEASTPFVFLRPVVINNGGGFSVGCNGDGTASVTVSVSGGLPAYDSINEDFTVSVTGATYTGASTVSNGDVVSITLENDGDWSLTFTDGAGCESSISGTFVASECGGEICNADAGTASVSTDFVCFGDDDRNFVLN